MPKVSDVGPRWRSPDGAVEIWQGDAAPTLALLPPKSVQCCVTSPPYWGLRAYATGDDKHQEIGCERTPEEFVAKMVEVFRAVRRVLRDDGVLWLNLGDTYGGAGTGGNAGGSIRPAGWKGDAHRIFENNGETGLPSGNLVGVPWRVALALQADGWVLRSDVPWVKRSAMPESVTNRPAKALEYVFMLTKGQGYYFDMEAVRAAPSGQTGGACFGKIKQGEDNCRDAGQGACRYNRPKSEDAPGRAFRNADLWFASVEKPWGVVGVGDEIVGLDVTSGGGYDGAHFATFPPKLIEPLIKAATSERGCCARCGARWERLLARIGGPQGNHVLRDGVIGAKGDCYGNKGVSRGKQLTAAYEVHGFPEYRTLGWQPGCGCADAEVVPCAVLDPFLGSGTTALVSLALGRRCVGIDLSATYIDEHSVPRVKAWLANNRAEARPPIKAIRVDKAAQVAQVQGDEL